jgi:hypothetical protein
MEIHLGWNWVQQMDQQKVQHLVHYLGRHWVLHLEIHWD